jgi:predicted glycosyltransferase
MYLDQNVFNPLSFNEINRFIKLKKGEKLIFVRFVAWNAVHDINQKRLSLQEKISLIKELSKYAKVVISSEGDLPSEIKQYELKAPKKIIHSILKYSDLVISESGTMTTESVLLGTPTILTIDKNFAIQFGNFDKLIENGLLKVIFDTKMILKNIDYYLSSKYKKTIKKSASALWSETININQFLLSIIYKELKI